MKATGIVRRLDQLGRVVLPTSLRKELGIQVGDGMEIFVVNGAVVLQKYQPGCVFCGETQGTQNPGVAKWSADGVRRNWWSW